MKFFGIIPARYGSSRFPGKPLADIGGKTMIQRVYEQAMKAGCLSQVTVATDDERIHMHVTGFEGRAVMTSPHHGSGTERVHEAASHMRRLRPDDVVINIQGDEPFIDPVVIDLLARCFRQRNTHIATLAVRLSDDQRLRNPNVPKVIIGKNSEALYFSRSPVPFCRDTPKGSWTKEHTCYQHIGIYAYRVKILRKIVALPPSPLEVAESLEQLRWLENGYSIKVVVTAHESISIDTPEDLVKAEELISER